MHIPKTAGLSLQGLARRRYKVDGQLKLIYTQEANEKGFKDSHLLKVVMGHYRFGYHQYSDRSFRYFTFLREPVSHVVSHYNYIFDHPEKFEYLPTGIKSIIDFAQCPYGYNLQTRFISGIDQIKGIEKKALQIAKENLVRHFEVIGLTEEFDTSLLMLGKALGWNRLYYVRENTGISKTKNKPSLQEVDQIKIINQYDMELYEFAKMLFQNQVSKHPDIQKELVRFQFNNKWFNTLNPTYIKLKKALGKA